MTSFADFNPIGAPDVWDDMVVGTMVCPGICKIGDLKRKNTWDVKKGKGTLGATITFVGREPVSFPVVFYLWTEAHFTAWDAFIKQFEFDPTKKKVTAIGVFHPALASININSVVIESIGAVKNEGKGLYSITVEFLEYFPPPKKAASGTPSGTKNSGSSGANKPPGTTAAPIVDAQQAEIERLLEKAKP